MEDAPDPRTLVDPELLPMLELFPTVDLTAELVPLLRARPPWIRTDPKDLERAVVVDRAVPGPAGCPDVAVRIYRPKDCEDVLPCILHIHGGGYVAGAPKDVEGAHLPLAANLRCCIVSVDYRLAPETPFPGAIEDCYAALSWVVAHADELRIDPNRLGVMGESAGGGLAASLALLVRDRGHYRLAFQHLTYPMLDDRTCNAPDPHPHTGQFLWTPASNRFGWSCLLGGAPGGEGISEYAAATRAATLEGLPPAFIATGSLDLFLEEDLDYARRLTRAGVPVELHVYPGAFHGFNAWPDARVAADARRDSVAALARSLAGG